MPPSARKAAMESRSVAMAIPDDPWPESKSWPESWKKKVTVRQSGATKGRKDYYWYTPIRNYQLRSQLEIVRFMDALQACDGDEDVAMKMLNGKKTKHQASVESGKFGTKGKTKKSKKTAESTKWARKRKVSMDGGKSYMSPTKKAKNAKYQSPSKRSARSYPPLAFAGPTEVRAEYERRARSTNEGRDRHTLDFSTTPPRTVDLSPITVNDEANRAAVANESEKIDSFEVPVLAGTDTVVESFV